MPVKPSHRVGGYRPNRPRPSAYVGESEHRPTIGFNRRIVLSTGRGSVKVSPSEARMIAAELLACANEVDEMAKTTGVKS